MPLCGEPETELVDCKLRRVLMEEEKSELVGKEGSGSESRIPLNSCFAVN